MISSAREDRRPVLYRIDRMAVGAWIVFAMLMGVYWFHQVLHGDEYAKQAESNKQRSVPITAPRGFILDRSGTVLAENEPAFTLLLYRRDTKDLEGSLRFLSSLFGRPLEELRRRERERASYDFVPVVVQENLTLAEVGAIEAHGLEHPEFVVQTAERRVYTQGKVAAHLLGHLGEATMDQLEKHAGKVRPGESIGQKGVEAAYQDLLAGTSGARSVVIDSFGREVGESGKVDPLPGNKLYLTIDLPLQQLAEESFKDRVGSAIAMDPKTGEILALVSAPEFDPNMFTRRVTSKEWDALIEDENHPLNNRVLQNVYSPGSVFKAFAAYAALNHGIDPKERVFCNGAATFYGRSFRCHGRHGSVDLKTALQVSCDVYFYTMGKRVGIDGLADAARAFGFGKTTGIDMAHEKAGIVPSPEWSLAVRKHPWYLGETISVAIGQGPLLVSAVQVARAFAGLANRDGALPVPHLFHVGENVRTGERYGYRPAAADAVPFPPGAREEIVEGLWRVVNQPGGTAYSSRVDGIDLCGKTGSVQVVGQKDTKKAHLLPQQLRDHGWFAGFAPKDDPKIVVVVFAEHGEHGATAAAPLAAKMAALYLKRPAGPAPRLLAPEPAPALRADADRPAMPVAATLTARADS
ncbi:MAG TPA: penicillin-binding protein 2 [Thermoanaerobaculia bacterium]|nr:penicillin-binding protein 2 [Thermoanaerobaculia bacterium]